MHSYGYVGTPSSSSGEYKELHAGQHAYVTVLGVPSIFRATLMSLGKVRTSSSSVGDELLLLIVFLKSSFKDFSLKLLDRRVEWSRLSWTRTWNKLCSKNELQPSKARIKCSSVINVSYDVLYVHTQDSHSVFKFQSLYT